MHRKIKLIFNYILILTLVSVFALGCGRSEDEPEDTKEIILTTGFNDKELFRIENVSCYLDELMVYLVNTANQYEAVYGPQIWQVVSEGISMEESVKNNALSQISQIKAMNLRASEYGVTLDDGEKEKAREAAEEYFSSLNSYEISFMGVSADSIYRMYCDYALADKLYRELIKDINPEISDDAARTITVEHILIKTYSLDGQGKKVEYSERAKADARNRIDAIYVLATDGEHKFTDLVNQYSEGTKEEYSFCMGEAEPLFETTAFNLGKDEISEVIETGYGYHIIKCISTFNQDETDVNKERITREEQERVFGANYDEFANTLRTFMNDELWNSITIRHDEGVNTQTFFEVYHKYFD